MKPLQLTASFHFIAYLQIKQIDGFILFGAE
jgi:hypothetical protein